MTANFKPKPAENAYLFSVKWSKCEKAKLLDGRTCVYALSTGNCGRDGSDCAPHKERLAKGHKLNLVRKNPHVKKDS